MDHIKMELRNISNEDVIHTWCVKMPMLIPQSASCSEKKPDVLMCQLGAGMGIKEGVSGGEEPLVSTKT
jgi:hypothetical protein